MKLVDDLRRNRRLRRAVEAANAGRADDALAAVSEVLADEPDHVDALRLLGRLRFGLGDFDAAEAAYRRIIGLDAGDADATESLRQTLIKQAFAARDEERGDRAIERLRAALELDPNDAFVHYNLGNVFAETPNRIADALDCWQRAVALRPDYVEPHFDLAQVFVYNARYGEAIRHLDVIARQRPDWPAPLYLLAVCHVQSGAADLALAYLKTAILINPGWSKTAANDANFASLRGNPEFDGLADVDAVVRVDELSRNVLTVEDLERDVEEYRRERVGDEDKEPSDDS
jgi:tetratricopeptide (TPR) repeat protein